MGRKKKKSGGKASKNFRHSLKDQLSSLPSPTPKNEHSPDQTPLFDDDLDAWEREVNKTTAIHSTKPGDAQWRHLQHQLEQVTRSEQQKTTALEKAHREVAELRKKLFQAEQQKKTLQEERTRERRTLQQEIRELRAQTHVPVPETKEIIEVSDWFQDLSLPESQWEEAFLEMQTSFGSTSYQHLSLTEEDHEWWKKRVRVVCSHAQCQQVWAEQQVALLTVDNSSSCQFCEGSDNRRSFRFLLLELRRRGLYKVVVVGGSPETRKELERLLSKPHQWKLIDGKERRDKQQALQDLRSADFVVLWGSTILPHKVSMLYTQYRERFPGKLVLLNKRGVASLAEEILQWLKKEGERSQ